MAGVIQFPAKPGIALAQIPSAREPGIPPGEVLAYPHGLAGWKWHTLWDSMA